MRLQQIKEERGEELLAKLGTNEAAHSLTKTQYRRLHKFLTGQNTYEIAREESVAPSVVNNALNRAINNLEDVDDQ